MPVSISDFWRLAVESRLLTPEQCQPLAVAFGQMKGAAQSSAAVLAEWLISQNVISRYQATILLAGHPGPFHYGDFRIYDRLDLPPLVGVFRAVHLPTGHPVMLQFLTGPETQHPQLWAALAGRVQTERRMVHPHLHRGLDAVDLQAFKFLVVEDLPGQSVEQMLAGGKRLPPQEACRIARCVALGLSYLHQSGTACGDVRPATMWMEPSGNVRLLRDFTAPPQPVNLFQSDPQGLLLARANYFAPEFTQAGKAPDAVTDLYGLGCSLYELLAGRPPFPGGDLRQKMHQHATQPFQPLEHMGVPMPIAQIVTYLMAKNPSVRYQQAGQVAEQLKPFCDPSRADFQPQVLPTAAAYEATLQARAMPLVGPGRSFSMAAPMATSPIAAGRAPVALGGPQVAVAPVVAVKPAIQVGSTAPVVVATSGVPAVTLAAKSTNLPQKKEQKQIKKAIVAICCVGAALIFGLILLNAMGGGNSKKPGDGETAQNGETDGGEDGGTDSSGGIDGGGTESGTAGTASTDNTAASSGTSATVAEDPAAQALTAADRYQVVPDDGKLPWATPTNGTPVSLRYVPPGSQFILVARPADMLASGEGARVLQSLGPAFERSLGNWQTTTGLKLADVEQLILTLHGEDGPFPQPALVVRLVQPIDKAALLAQLGNPAAAAEANGTIYNGSGGWSYLIPDDAAGRVFVMGPAAQLRDVLEFKGAPPSLRLGMSKLQKVSDSQRHFTLLFSPNELIVNLFRDGRQIALGEPRKLREAVDWFLGDQVEAGMVSGHFGSGTYLELMMVGQVSQTKDALASEIRDRLQQLPDLVEQYVVGLDPPPYWKQIAFRYPSMIRELHGQTRIGGEGDIAVINAMLPGPAAHNLLFASEMALSSSPGAGGSSSATPTAVAAKPAAPKTIEELLDTRTSLAFGADSLEFSMQNVESVAKENFPDLPFPFAVKILGPDLEKNGITRNQQIRDFNESNKTIAEILTSMVMKANPIKTVKQPNEVDQQLIWVIEADPADASRRIVLITTRDAAAAKNYKLPAVFQPK